MVKNLVVQLFDCDKSCGAALWSPAAEHDCLQFGKSWRVCQDNRLVRFDIWADQTGAL